jgi:hypothetical protein
LCGFVPQPTRKQQPNPERQRDPLRSTALPLKTPFEPALRTVDAVGDIVVMVSTDTRHVGYGLIGSDFVLIGVIRIGPRQVRFSRA